jgi:hypothetical protein
MSRVSYLHHHRQLLTLYSPSQPEAALLCRVATGHDVSAAHELESKEGWRTLDMILRTTGEQILHSRIPKRGRESESSPTIPPAAAAASLSPHTQSPSSSRKPRTSGEPLAKKLAACRLNERRPVAVAAPSLGGEGSVGGSGDANADASADDSEGAVLSEDAEAPSPGDAQQQQRRQPSRGWGGRAREGKNERRR